MNGAKAVKLKEKDIFAIYKASYKIPIPWDDVLDRDVYEWMVVFQNGRNCSIPLTMSCLLSIIPVMCGPNTSISTSDGSFTTSLNMFIMSVCDPGGGKTNTHNNVLLPILEEYEKRNAMSLHIENYTIPGIQVHQKENNGYGIISTDEGNRFLNNLRAKQAKGESDVPFLCKLWGGKGDSTTLATGKRGFAKSSISLNIAIQPDPMLTELQHFISNDGFIDRFLFISARPHLSKTAETRKYFQLLNTSNLRDLTAPIMHIYDVHLNQETKYVLSQEAQQCYDMMVDAYVTYINDKYDCDSGKFNLSKIIT